MAHRRGSALPVVLVLLLVSPRRSEAVDSTTQCRLTCERAKTSCIEHVQKRLHDLRGNCSSPGLRRCRRSASRTARAGRRLCNGFALECHTCCDARGSECAKRCGDGIVTAGRGEECDPPGSLCNHGTTCDEKC